MKTSIFSFLLLGAALSVACKSGDPTAEFCETLLGCDCSAPAYVDADACVTDIKGNFEDLEADAARLGLTFDSACTDTLLDAFTGIGCKGPAEVEYRDLCVACAPIHGDKALGAACTETDGWSDCGRDLECRDGACVDPCKIYKAGETCAVVDGDFVDASGLCDEGLFCDYEDSGTCKPLQGVGGACPGFSGCTEGLYCGADMKCAPLPKEGEACTFVCEQGFVCDETGACAPGPGVGEPCAAFGCGPGLDCNLETETCGELEPLLCTFGIDEEMPAG